MIDHVRLFAAEFWTALSGRDGPLARLMRADDFLVPFQSGDWEARCERSVAEFACQARKLHDEMARRAGGIHAGDRRGVLRFFPCTTVSIGAVPVSPRQYRDAEEGATQAALAKREAELAGRGPHVLARRAQEIA
jgi:hypothetical protein